jgi:hypothetical protein
MKISDFKKKNKTTALVNIEGLDFKVRKIKTTDYFDRGKLPSIYSLQEDEAEAALQNMEPQEVEDMFSFIKNIVCSCVIPDPDNDHPAVVDKPDSECKDWEISFTDTLEDSQAFSLFNEIQKFSVAGGLQSVEVFQEKPVPDKIDPDDGGKVREVAS